MKIKIQYLVTYFKPQKLRLDYNKRKLPLINYG